MVNNFIPPFNSGKNKSYVDALREKLNEYVSFVKTIRSIDRYVSHKIEHLNNLILTAISDIKNANSQEAYSRICQFILDEKDSINLPSYNIKPKKHLIRLRYSESDLRYREDVFHIPNSLRYRVAQQRYSIPGVPCLYLSGCAFTAWLELNKPNFSNLWCAGFKSIQDIKVLDLAMRLDAIINEEDNMGKLIFYPFVIATSYATKYPDSPFKEEYIISNILLQAIINITDFKGIRYFSTRTSNYKPEYIDMASNIVLPAISLQSEYDKELADSFILTYPQPCSVLMHSPNAGDVVSFARSMDDSTIGMNEQDRLSHIETKIYEWYWATQFFNIDGHIQGLSFGHIENC